jgi:hypothetical protein
MPRFARLLLLTAPLLLSACDGGREDSAPGGVSQDEAAALNDAAAMLDNDAMAANVVVAPPKD